jgi:hypothetical protein
MKMFILIQKNTLYNMNIPYNIKSLLEGNNINNEEVLYENKLFILIKDIKHDEKSYHYTAFIKEDVRSLIEINYEIIDSILYMKNNLLEKNLIQTDDFIFIHFPPSIWRLHIHFVDKNHKFISSYHEIFFLDEVIEKISLNKKYYIENVVIKSKL